MFWKIDASTLNMNRTSETVNRTHSNPSELAVELTQTESRFTLKLNEGACERIKTENLNYCDNKPNVFMPIHTNESRVLINIPLITRKRKALVRSVVQPTFLALVPQLKTVSTAIDLMIQPTSFVLVQLQNTHLAL